MAGDFKVYIRGELHSVHDDRDIAHNTIMDMIRSGEIPMGVARMGIPPPPGGIPEGGYVITGTNLVTATFTTSSFGIAAMTALNYV